MDWSTACDVLWSFGYFGSQTAKIETNYTSEQVKASVLFLGADEALKAFFDGCEDHQRDMCPKCENLACKCGL